MQVCWYFSGRQSVTRGETRPSGLALLLALALLAVAAVFTACGSSKQESTSEPSATVGAQPGAAEITDEAKQQAKDIFSSRCSVCHGKDGRGDGPGSANLNPKPTNFHDEAWQKAVTDEEIEKAILYGGSAVGKSPFMVPNPDLQSQPAVVSVLREEIRQLRGK